MRNRDRFRGCLIGGAAGDALGYEAIPEKYKENLELKNVILEVADDLWHDCRMTEYDDGDDPDRGKKYIEMSYRPG